MQYVERGLKQRSVGQGNLNGSVRPVQQLVTHLYLFTPISFFNDHLILSECTPYLFTGALANALQHRFWGAIQINQVVQVILVDKLAVVEHWLNGTQI
jgi:hypothetical protein